MRRLIAYAGEPGAFGEEACLACFPCLEPVNLPDFAAVAAAVAAAAVSAGVIPVHNSCAGAVPGVSGLLKNPDLRIAGYHPLPVAIHCVGLPGARLDDVEEVHSHPVALRQSGLFLASLDAVLVAASDTAGAARHVAWLANPAMVALASARAARIHGLTVIRANVSDQIENVTTFAIIEKVSPASHDEPC
ncbi:prephenate dehydratase domain-containing protein [Porphyrobacter sp. GA68]|uniref:prephenate dehydratase domain-containing protein n=1 Tax=Porphyrobacter sp. GA68 TaxID=2883480 RepID=UPI001D18B804|nr:prephenate dehydratase domain-containing protein [Porphyrobacter sp. GA68]